MTGSPTCPLRFLESQILAPDQTFSYRPVRGFSSIRFFYDPALSTIRRRLS